jgi:AraC-like DNA-binding protein
MDLPPGFDPMALPVPPSYPTEREIREIVSSSTDALSALIRRTRVRSIIPRICTFSAPWALCLNTPTGGFFAVRSGSMHARIDRGEHQCLGAGDVVVFFRSGMHWVGDPPGTPAKALFEIITRQDMRRRRGLESLKDPPSVTFNAGGFIEVHGLAPEIERQLPPMLVIRADETDRPPILDRFLAATDAANEHPGTRDLANDLIASAIFGSALHVALSRLRGNLPPTHPAAVMFDPDLGPVVRLMRDFPDRPWTMQSIADEAGLSRSTFHERFVAAMKTPPMAYLRSVRLGLARQLLAAGTQDITKVARRAGYGSISAFVVAFRREFDASPSQVAAAGPGTAPPSPDAT